MIAAMTPTLGHLCKVVALSGFLTDLQSFNRETAVPALALVPNL